MPDNQQKARKSEKLQCQFTDDPVTFLKAEDLLLFPFHSSDVGKKIRVR
jgi:hypothetical protein